MTTTGPEWVRHNNARVRAREEYRALHGPFDTAGLRTHMAAFEHNWTQRQDRLRRWAERPTRRRRALHRLLLFVLWALGVVTGLVLAGCSGPFSARDAVPFDPPASYRAVWDSAQACSGRHGRFDALHFFLAEHLEDRHQVQAGHEEGMADGMVIWFQRGFEYHPMVVKHEMLHALGIHGHPRVFYYPCRAMWSTFRRPYEDLAR